METTKVGRKRTTERTAGKLLRLPKRAQHTTEDEAHEAAGKMLARFRRPGDDEHLHGMGITFDWWEQDGADGPPTGPPAVEEDAA